MTDSSLFELASVKPLSPINENNKIWIAVYIDTYYCNGIVLLYDT